MWIYTIICANDWKKIKNVFKYAWSNEIKIKNLIEI